MGKQAILRALVFSVVLFTATRSFALDCKIPPPMAESIGGVDYYVDEKKSVIDTRLQKDSEEQIRALRTALLELGELVDNTGNYGANDSPRCALNWLQQWASGRAFERIDKGGTVVRVVSMASITLSYRTAIAKSRGDYIEFQAVNRWLERVISSIVSNEDSGRPGDQRNNVTYWAALAAYNVSVITNSMPLRKWALGVYRQALDELTPDGFIPSELKRGRQALRYQWFALTPLVILYVTAREGEGFRASEYRVQLRSAISAARSSLVDGVTISKLAGVEVERDGITNYAITRVTNRLAECIISDAPNQPAQLRDRDLARDWRVGSAFPILHCNSHFEFLRQEAKSLKG